MASCENSHIKVLACFCFSRGAAVIRLGRDYRPGAHPRSFDHIRSESHFLVLGFKKQECFDMAIAPSRPIMGVIYSSTEKVYSVLIR